VKWSAPDDYQMIIPNLAVLKENKLKSYARGILK